MINFKLFIILQLKTDFVNLIYVKMIKQPESFKKKLQISMS